MKSFKLHKKVTYDMHTRTRRMNEIIIHCNITSTINNLLYTIYKKKPQINNHEIPLLRRCLDYKEYSKEKDDESKIRKENCGRDK